MFLFLLCNSKVL